MVGPLNTPDTPGTDAGPLTSVDVSKTGVAGFLSSTAGKLVLGGVLLAVLGGVIAFLLITFVFSSSTDTGVIITPVSGSTTTSATASETPERRRDPKLDSVFTFRNIFQPSVKPSVATSASSSSGSSSTVNVPANTLYLMSVSVQDGKDVGTFIWNGTTYTAGDGETLGSTPWKVLSISGNSAEMLYGDSRITLVVGQGLGK